MTIKQRITADFQAANSAVKVMKHNIQTLRTCIERRQKVPGRFYLEQLEIQMDRLEDALKCTGL